MKVKYIIDNLKEKYKGIKEETYSEYLVLGKEYVVYGIDYLDNGKVKFMIGDDCTPNLYPSSFFEVTDNQISKYWVGTTENYYPLLHPKVPFFISFKEMNEDYYFFDKLLDDERDGHTETVELYWKYIELMNNEFPEPDLQYATIIDGSWLMCAYPYCDSVWEENTENGIVICPKNSHRNNNPLL